MNHLSNLIDPRSGRKAGTVRNPVGCRNAVWCASGNRIFDLMPLKIEAGK
jgi:hypothetical protein